MNNNLGFKDKFINGINNIQSLISQKIKNDVCKNNQTKYKSNQPSSSFNRNNKYVIKRTLSLPFTSMIRLTIMMIFAFIVANTIIVAKFLIIKRDYNLGTANKTINKVDLLNILYNELWYVPLLISLYWLIFISIMDILLFFIEYLIKTNSGEGNIGISDNKTHESLRDSLSIKFGMDLKITILFMIFNNFILIPYIWFQAIFFSKQSQINLDKIGNIYKYSLILALMVFSLYFNYNIEDSI